MVRRELDDGRAAARRSRGGFTLIELLVALLILGMVAGIVGVAWDRILPSTRLDSDVRALSARLHGARSDAIARNAEFWLLYDLEEQQYWIQAPYDSEGRVVSMERVLRDARGEELPRAFLTKLRDGVRFEEITIDGKTYRDNVGGFPYVRFDPLGGSNDHTIVLHQPKYDRYYTIEVLGLTGQIRFHEGFYHPEQPEASEFK